MTKKRRRKCLNCPRLFRPDPRNVRHQRYCSALACGKASKVASEARWLSKAQNRNYFRGPEHVENVERVRAWRAANLGHARRGRRALQEDSFAQIVDPAGKTISLTTAALQEDSYAQSLVLTGLIASLTGTALQEDIARSRRRFQQLALDILQKEPRHGSQTPAPPRAAPRPAELGAAPPCRPRWSPPGRTAEPKALSMAIEIRSLLATENCTLLGRLSERH